MPNLLLLIIASTLASSAAPLTIVNAASDSAPVAAGSIASAFGSGLGTAVSITDSAGVMRAATLFYVSGTQVNFLVPAQATAGSATVTITSSDGTVSIANILIATVAPGLFSANGNGQGAAAADVVQIDASGSQSLSFADTCGGTPSSCVATPITVNTGAGQTILELFGTGIRGASSLAGVTCTIGGTPAQILYAGAQGPDPGLDQVNVVLPAGVANQGLVNIALTVNGASANIVQVNTGQAANLASFYVAINGNDQWSGTLPSPNSTATDGPFASLAKAQSAVRSLIKTNPARPVSVMLRNGTYYLPGTLNFTAADSGAANQPVTWQNYPGETPIVSGGIPLGGTWKNVSGNLWQTPLPANTQPFEYLFYNGVRRMRPRVAWPSGIGYYTKGSACYSTQTGQTVPISQCNLGTFFRVAVELSPTGPDAACPSVTNSSSPESKCLDRFGYNPSDPIASWINLNASGSQCTASPNPYPVGDIEITIFDAWTVDIMRIACVDTTRHVIYFTTATKGNPSNYNFFGPTLGHRYVVDNALDAFNAARSAGQTGVWFLDRSTSPWTLNYLANPNENPNSDTVVIAQSAPATDIGGSLLSAVNLSYVTFRGISFEVDNFIPPPGGFNSDENGESTLPAAVDCESCQNVTFDSVVVRHTSASGLQIASSSGNSGLPATGDVIENSAFYDIGSSGIHIGHHPLGSDKAANVVQLVTVQNNIVQGYSRVFADGEGIAQGNGHDITYTHNDVTDGYHAGISVCLLGCPSTEFAASGTNITSSYNHIWNTMQGLTSDGGTLYYNIGSAGGSGTGNKMLNNLVHDVTDSSILDVNIHGSGYGGHGIYIDNQSAGVDVENNVVYRVAGSTVFITEGPAPGQLPHMFRNNIFGFGRESMFLQATTWPQGCGMAPSPEVNMANNIFYFDLTDSAGFYVTQGCADSCGLPYNQFQNFQGNLYWRTDGGFSSYSKAFHVLTKAPTGDNASTCTAPGNPGSAWTFLTFPQWQNGTPLVNGSALKMGEDSGGTVTVNPGFGNSGLPADYMLSSSPVAGFDFSKTNDTILHAGRNNPVIMPPIVPPTYPTYTFTTF